MAKGNFFKKYGIMIGIALVVLILILIIVFSGDKEPVDCSGEWGEWDECSLECGGGTQQREYKITKEAKNGGESCANEDGETEERECNIQECNVYDAVDVDDFKNKFCGTEICNTDYGPGWGCQSTYQLGYGNGGAYKDTLEECKEGCASKYPDTLGLVADYNPPTSSSNPKLCTCRTAECMDAPPADDPTGEFNRDGRWMIGDGFLGYAHCSSC